MDLTHPDAVGEVLSLSGVSALADCRSSLAVESFVAFEYQPSHRPSAHRHNKPHPDRQWDLLDPTASRSFIRVWKTSVYPQSSKFMTYAKPSPPRRPDTAQSKEAEKTWTHNPNAMSNRRLAFGWLYKRRQACADLPSCLGLTLASPFLGWNR